MPTTPPSQGPGAARRRPYMIASGVFLATVVVVGLGSLLVIQRWYGGDDRTPIDDPGASGSGSGSPLTVTLYYLAEDGLGLVRHEQDIPDGVDTLSRARAIIERQLGEAPSPLMSPFPAGTRLHSIYLADDGNAFVDLSREVTTGHSGGSLDELFTVYALVNALTTNVPEIVAVQIMIEGEEVDTLAGHIDLRQPLEPSMKWVVEPTDEEPSSTAG